MNLGYKNKNEDFEKLKKKYTLSADQILYMGDDIPDIPPMKLVGLPTCPQDAVPEVKAVSKYISHKNGGEGSVRDIIQIR